MKVRLYKITDHESWNNYVTRHAEGSIFHLIQWRNVVAQIFHHQAYYLVAEEGKANKKDQLAIVGVLPLFHIKSRLFGDYMVSIPFAELGGVLADSDEIARRLLAEAVTLTEELNLDYLELRQRRPLAELQTKSLYYNFNREIFPILEDNMQAIPRKARRMIRQGDKNGLKATMGHHQLAEFYELMAKNYHQLGTPIFPQRWFAGFLKAFADKAYISLIRETSGQPIAGVLGFVFKDQVIPYYAGSLIEKRRLAPNDFMYWELMKWGCENGYRIFDFGRSKVDTGSYDFKRHWGFEPKPLAYQYHLHRLQEMPNLSPANPKYKRKIELWRKMPLSLTKIVGPQIARALA